ncbi:MAG: ABC transporter permease [Armatimonadetes bacterium]|nr:ABC transporter permease [Armatimonadota bacterium]
MLAELKELWRFRELLYSMVERELKIRYKNSFLGFFWSLLNPLMTVAVLTFVFRNYVGYETKNLSAYILAAYLPFVFFQMSVLDSAQSVLSNVQLIKKIYFPREILPLAQIISNFIHLTLALLVFFGYLLFVYWRDPTISPFQATSFYLPLVLLVNLALAAGVGLLVSALNTFYEDVKYIVTVMLWMLLFLCPVMYFSETVYAKSLENGQVGIGYYLYHLNPVAMLCTAYRKILVAPQPVEMKDASGHVATLPALPMDWALFGMTALTSVVLLVVGYAVFNRLKWRFVERP